MSRKKRTFWIAYFPGFPEPFQAFDSKAKAKVYVKATNDHFRERLGVVEGPFLVRDWNTK